MSALLIRGYLLKITHTFTRRAKIYKNGDKQNKVIDNKVIKYYNLIK